MRRYIPFATSASADSSQGPPSAASTSTSVPPSSSPDAPSPTADTDGFSHRMSYLPTLPALPALPAVPALPSVRKYLFSSGGSGSGGIHAHGNSHTASDLRRRLSSGTGCGGASADATSPSPLRAQNAAVQELTTMADHEFGPVGEPSKNLLHLGTDRLAATLNAGVQERERLLMQFLRARHHNAHEALLMINNALRWRKSMDIEVYLTHSVKNMIKPAACFPMHIISTPDKCKQPVVYGLIRLLDKKKVDREPFHNALLSFLEAIYFGDTYVLDEMVIILDFRDWSIRRNAPYRLVKDGIQTLQDYYPERLGRVIIVNYPTSIRAAYTAISPIIDAGAKEKIVWIADADPSATLRKLVAPKSIPSFMGGELEATFPATWPDIAAEFAVHNGRTKSHS